jgi:hypothetical protein
VRLIALSFLRRKIHCMARRALRGGLAALAAATLATALAAIADAHEIEGVAAIDHAKEHEILFRLAERDERRWNAMSPAERQAKSEQATQEALAYARTTSGDPRQVGKWTKAPFELPNYAIHAAMLPTGKILFWGYPFYDDLTNRGEASLWDPTEGYGPGAFEDVDPPLVDPDGDGPQGMVSAPIYCSGQSFLPSGELLVAGGNLAWPFQDSRYQSAAGSNFVFTFDPWSERWTQQPSMEDGRWYPSQVELADGTTLLAGGYSDDQPGGIDNADVEVFNPSQVRGGIGTIGKYASAERETELYPHLFTLPSGDALLAGPGHEDSAILPLSTLGGGSPLAWQDLPETSGFRIGGSAVLRPGSPDGSWKVTQFGGYGTIPQDHGVSAASTDSETIDARKPQKGWKKGPGLKLGRSYQNTLLLPDESLVTVGGGTGFSQENGNWTIDSSGAHRRVEVLKAGSDHWRMGPAQLEDRSYHSTALLMPDGRVWSAGDDRYPLESDGTKARSDSAEIYSPPYLFRGQRPKLKGASESANYNQIFFATTADAKPPARKFVLVAPGATTHGADMQQRVVPLRVDRREGTTTALRAPANSAIAPPGRYMLFALSGKGVPAVARWINLSY